MNNQELLKTKISPNSRNPWTINIWMLEVTTSKAPLSSILAFIFFLQLLLWAAAKSQFNPSGFLVRPSKNPALTMLMETYSNLPVYELHICSTATPRKQIPFPDSGCHWAVGVWKMQPDRFTLQFVSFHFTFTSYLLSTSQVSWQITSFSHYFSNSLIKSFTC